MVHISNAGLVHRDLSMRNVLCADLRLLELRLVVKIGDFGRTSSAPYTGKFQWDDLPLRWTAPEVLRDGRHGTQADVWAFGVFIWELTESQSAIPFAGIEDAAVRAKILGHNDHDGFYGVLPQPVNCSDVLYAVACDCWRHDEGKRPEWEILEHRLRQICQQPVPVPSAPPPSAEESTGYHAPNMIRAGLDSGEREVQKDSALHQLCNEMGFDKEIAARALETADGDIRRAVTVLLS